MSIAIDEADDEDDAEEGTIEVKWIKFDNKCE